MTFADARPWAVAIKEEVLQRRMPPWPAAKGFGDFANDISLPQEEINRLAEWAEGGAPEGEPQWLRPAFAVPPWRAAAPPQGRVIPLPEVLTAPMTILAIRPVAHRKPLASEKSWAETADGAVVPLVWLTGAAKPQWLIYRVPVQLPAGSRIRGRGLDVMVR